MSLLQRSAAYSASPIYRNIKTHTQTDTHTGINIFFSLSFRLVLGFMCCTVFLSMWLSNTSTTAMVMPIAEAVLQQLICTGLADQHDDSETAEAPEDGMSGGLGVGGRALGSLGMGWLLNYDNASW